MAADGLMGKESQTGVGYNIAVSASGPGHVRVDIETDRGVLSLMLDPKIAEEVAAALLQAGHVTKCKDCQAAIAKGTKLEMRH